MKINNLQFLMVIVMIAFLQSCAIEKDEVVTRFPNGLKKEVCEVENGVRNGVCIEFDSLGNVVMKSTWLDGNKNGITQHFDSKGNLESEYSFNNNQITGLGREYYSNGKVKLEGNFTRGFGDGIFKYYSKDGLLESKRQYLLVDDESRLNQFIKFDSDGDTLWEQSNWIKVDTLFNAANQFDGIRIELMASFFDEEKLLIIGEFDEDFKALKATDTIQSSTGVFNLSVSEVPSTILKRAVLIERKTISSDSGNIQKFRKILIDTKKNNW